MRLTLGKFGIRFSWGIPVQIRRFRNKEQKRVFKAKEDK